MNNRRALFVRASVPYFAVAVGLYLFHSAWASILMYHAGIIFFLLLNRRSLCFSHLFQGLNLRVLAISMVVFVFAGPAVYFFWPLACPEEGILTRWLSQNGLTGTAWLVCMPYFSIIHPFLEELHWRNITGKLSKRSIWADIAFAGFHVPVLIFFLEWYWVAFSFCVLVACSLFWKWTARRFNGIGIPVVTHTMADLSVMAAVQIMLLTSPV